MPALLDEPRNPFGRAARVPCEERAGARAATPQGVRLSIAHTDGLPVSIPLPNTFRTWPGAALAIIPAGENRDPNLSKSPPRRGIRGKIVTLSSGARRRIKETLSKIAPVRSYTMALTLPKECRDISPAAVHSSFQKLGKQFTGSPAWRHAGLLYKREFQNCGALHYHIVVFGLKDDAASRDLQLWITQRWVRMICHGLPVDSPARSKMLAVHMHSSNMEPVRKSIASYFAKYLGKASNAPEVHVPGKWWGMMNQPAIPFVEEKTLILPPFVRDRARRMASALQRKRVQHALFKSACIGAGIVNTKNEPLLTLQEFNQAATYRNPPGFLDSLEANRAGRDFPVQTRRMACVFWRLRLIELGYRSGSHNRPRPSSFGKISLVGYGVPAIAERMIRHAAAMWRDHLTTHPF